MRIYSALLVWAGAAQVHPPFARTPRPPPLDARRCAISHSDKQNGVPTGFGRVAPCVSEVVCCALQAFDAIAGYAPRNNVVQYNQIDLDQKAIEDEVEDHDFSSAKSI